MGLRRGEKNERNSEWKCQMKLHYPLWPLFYSSCMFDHHHHHFAWDLIGRDAFVQYFRIYFASSCAVQGGMGFIISVR